MTKDERKKFLKSVDLTKTKFEIKIADFGFSKKLKKLEELQLFITQDEISVYITFTHLIKSGPKLKKVSDFKIKDHSIFSKALRKSIKNMRPGRSFLFK